LGLEIEAGGLDISWDSAICRRLDRQLNKLKSPTQLEPVFETK
jgi:hypothetical protein